jgi:hypothetical protein
MSCILQQHLLQLLLEVQRALLVLQLQLLPLLLLLLLAPEDTGKPVKVQRQHSR